MKKIIFLIVVLSLLLFPPKVYADSEFDISTQSNYLVFENGITKFTQIITIKNNKEFVYTPSYTLTTGLKDIQNLTTYSGSGLIHNKVEDVKDGGKSIEVTFDKRFVGVGVTNQFTISFESSEIAKKVGNIWEVDVPGLSNPDDYSSYSTTLSVPNSFGLPLVVKPNKKLSGKNFFSFTKDEIGKSGISIQFGENQYYKLNLSYYISNSNVFPVKTEIALIPDTSYQDVRITKIEPEPSDVYEDEDKNWLAVYKLSANEKKVINVTALVKLYSEPKNTETLLHKYNQKDTYWDSDDPLIKKYAQEFKTPEKIYDFVVSKLTYNYEKVSSENVRLGAKKALLKPDFAVCLEFSDLFVAIARAAGINARVVEGYAYTENSKLRPVSLLKDILHAWPEYYSETEKKWIMIDPTWGNTTLGMDYFNTLDFAHIAFVIKGKSSTYPVPAGGYKFDQNSKDISVSFISPSEFIEHKNIFLSTNLPSNALSGFPIEGFVTITNSGNSLRPASKLVVKSLLSSDEKIYEVGEIPPYGTAKVFVNFPRTNFLTNKSYTVTISIDGNSINKKIFVSIFPDLFLITLGGLIILGTTTIAITTVKTWSLYFQKRKR